MRSQSLIVLRLRALLAPRRILTVLAEVALVVWAILLLEAVGTRSTGEGADLVGVMVAGLLVAGLSIVARAGYMPATRAGAGAVKRGVLALLRRLDPPSGVAFRLPTDPPPRRDRSRRLPVLGLGALTVVVLVAGKAPLVGLEWVRDHVAYTPYLLGIGLVWALFAAVTTLALVTSRSAVRGGGVGIGSGRVARGLLLFALWLGAVVLLARIPGYVPVLAVFGACVAFGVRLARPRAGDYWLYRRDREGVVTAITLQGYLVGYYLLVASFLLFVTALAEGPRLVSELHPGGSFTLTHLFGLAASVSAFFLVVRTGLHVQRLFGVRSDAPEEVLVPTLWWPAGDLQLPWVDLVRERGWRVLDTSAAPEHDLVVGSDAGPRRFVPDPDLDTEDAAFRLERRFHVVKRRELFRCLHTLFKQVTARPRPPGCGYLFCPHAWPVPGVVRDTGGAEVEPGARSSIGGLLVGRPYRQVFSRRVRRYLAGVLRALDLDVLYWEDAVSWTDLRRVFGVLFETYDQGRFPVLDRHFIGLPRVVVMVQEPEEGDESYLTPPAHEGEDQPPPLRARALVIRRDGGGREAPAPDRAPSSRRPVPLGV